MSFNVGLAIALERVLISRQLDATFLSVSSDKQTVHIFKLETPAETAPQGWGGYLMSAASSAATYLPSPVTEMWTQSRSFAQVNLPVAGSENLAAVVGTGSDVAVYVASATGYLCKINREYDLTNIGNR